MRFYLYDVETPPNVFIVTFLSYEDDKYKTFVIDDDTGENDRDALIEFVQKATLVGYNNLTFDNIILNYIMSNKDVRANDLHQIANRIIGGQRHDKDFNLYKEFSRYIKSDVYMSIDLMRLLFSKKLRVGLKELECSLNYSNVEELPYAHDKVLTESEKKEVISYNINDCRATKLVLEKSMKALKLRRWMKQTYGIDAYSMDGVNGGVKILEVLYEKAVGNRNFFKERTFREWIHIKDIILPIVRFDTPEFQAVLERYQNHTWYSSHFDEKLFEDSKLKFEPVINGFKFKFSLGGLHGDTKPGMWESDDEYDIMSVDVESYYPSMVLMWEFVPAHLVKEIFLKIYSGVKEERLAAKASGDDMKNNTLKLSINGTFGMFGNKYSWLFDHRVRLQICVNGQLMLAMLIEKLFGAGIKLIDANTDGIYIKVHKSQKDEFERIIKEWEETTKMKMEQTKFEKLWFVNTADYFGTTLKKDGKVDVKEKGMFQSEVQLGKGMEFPVIAKAVKEYFLKGTPYEKYISEHDNILDFCSYKKLKYGSQCFHNEKRQQRINRFYACKTGAYLYKRTQDDNSVWKTSNLLKESPVEIYNKVIDKPMKDRNINYSFYLSKTREVIHAIEKDKNQTSLF